MTLKVLAAKLDMMILEAAGECEYVMVVRRTGAEPRQIWVSSNIPPADGALLLISAAATMGPDDVMNKVYGKGN